MTDLKTIWLSPDCGECSDERTWCQDNANDCPDCDAKAVKYVRADVHDALVKALQSISQRANESGTGEMGLLDTVHEIHRIADAMLKGAA